MTPGSSFDYLLLCSGGALLLSTAGRFVFRRSPADWPVFPLLSFAIFASAFCYYYARQVSAGSVPAIALQVVAYLALPWLILRLWPGKSPGWLAAFAPLILLDLSELFGLHVGGVAILRPLGYSYFVFRLYDAWRAPSARRPGDWRRMLLQSGAFPTLLAGPILLLGQFRIVRQPFHLTRPFYRHALLLLMLGTFKIKLLLPVFHFYFETALALAPGWNLDFFRNLLHTGLYYYIRLYLDFSGYTDIVVGICAIMGLKIRHNFRRPYLATNLADFWRRWHITLAAFVRRHVYIPLGGRDRGAARHVLHLGIVFVVIGLWHGLSGAFLLWGLAHWAYMVLEFYALSPLFRRARNVAPRATRVGQYLLTQIFVTLSWLIFFWK